MQSKSLCSKSVTGDPAAHLGIFVDGTDREGQPFQGWVHSDGKQKVKRMRRLVDYFEGREMYGCQRKPIAFAPA